MKVYLVAGEQSGDTHGSEVIAQLLKIHPNINLRGVGGQQLEKLGQHQIFNIKQMELVGISQVLRNVANIYYMLNEINKDMDNFKPNIILLIDYPGFNLRLAQRIRKHTKHINNTTIIYYIPPKIWLWGYRRVFDLKQYANKVFCIYPHEQKILQNEGVNATYAGNPAASNSDTNNTRHNNTETRTELAKHIQFHNNEQKQLLNKGTKILGWYPGSRQKEIDSNYKEILKSIELLNNYYIVVAALPINISTEQFHNIIGTTNINTIHNKTHLLMQNTHTAWAASGTVTLELAMHKVPTILYYHISQPSLTIGKTITGIKRIGIVNIILDKNIMPELINSQLNANNLLKHTEQLEKQRTAIQQDLQEVATLLGNHNPAQTVAQWISDSQQNTHR